jgi:hypothetical protein
MSTWICFHLGGIGRRVLADRREFPAREVIHVLSSFAQPELIADEELPIPTVAVENRTFWKRLFTRAEPAPLTGMPLLPRSVLAPIPLALN